MPAQCQAGAARMRKKGRKAAGHPAALSQTDHMRFPL